MYHVFLIISLILLWHQIFLWSLLTCFVFIYFIFFRFSLLYFFITQLREQVMYEKQTISRVIFRGGGVLKVNWDIVVVLELWKRPNHIFPQNENYTHSNARQKSTLYVKSLRSLTNMFQLNTATQSVAYMNNELRKAIYNTQMISNKYKTFRTDKTWP